MRIVNTDDAVDVLENGNCNDCAQKISHSGKDRYDIKNTDVCNVYKEYICYY